MAPGLWTDHPPGVRIEKPRTIDYRPITPSGVKIEKPWTIDYRLITPSGVRIGNQ
ncbi:MAG: hypothetical protein KTR30_12750 [Saprospiraceae bacterium]|nr:hypothetical protein [Saprospiraceae bacterium]